MIWKISFSRFIRIDFIDYYGEVCEFYVHKCTVIVSINLYSSGVGIFFYFSFHISNLNIAE